MDIKRTILIVALAIVSYVMVLKWNQDYGQAALPTQNTAASTAAPALPDTVAITRRQRRCAERQANQPLPNCQSASKDLIQSRPTCSTWLSIHGGDIVQLNLPKYPRRQDHPDIPFQLFDNGGERTYLAQSGLTGTNGPECHRSSGLCRGAEELSTG
jgi:YidC/Oxa1 family membrane protein insertase